MRGTLLGLGAVLLGLTLARPTPGSKGLPTASTLHLKSESFKPWGANLSPQEKATLVAELLEPEEWERYDGVYLGGKEQKLY